MEDKTWEWFKKLAEEVARQKEEAYIQGRTDGFDTAIETCGLGKNDNYKEKWDKLRKHLIYCRDAPFQFWKGWYQGLLDYMDGLEGYHE